MCIFAIYARFAAAHVFPGRSPPTFDFREVAAGVLQHSQDTGCISLWTVLSSILSSFQGKSEASKPWGLMPGVM